MKDETRDALLIAVAEWIIRNDEGSTWEVEELLKQAKHEQDFPNDRGA